MVKQPQLQGLLSQLKLRCSPPSSSREAVRFHTLSLPRVPAWGDVAEQNIREFSKTGDFCLCPTATVDLAGISDFISIHISRRASQCILHQPGQILDGLHITFGL